jgi:hypothetical protein
MKKLLVVAVVLAIACLSSMAFAAEVTVNGYVDVRSRLFENLDLDRSINNADTASRTTTETAFRIDVNVKADNAKAKLSLWNDHDIWGTNYKHNPDNNTNETNAGTAGSGASTANIREAWIDVMIPDMPVGIKAGHQLAQFGNGWFLRENYGGVDAWIVYGTAGKVTIAASDVKLNDTGGVNNTATNNTVNTNANDVDLYTVQAITKMGDNTININLSALKDDTGAYLGAGGPWASGQAAFGSGPGATGINQKGRLYNLGLNFDGKVGAATLKAEADFQQGEIDNLQALGNNTHIGITGNQVVAQGSMPMGALTLNATVARGSGNVNGSIPGQAGVGTGKSTQFNNVMDIGQHYTFLYEYRIKAASGFVNTGFSNTTALEVGAMYQATKSLAVGADLWFLRATEATNVALPAGSAASTQTLSRDLGEELDVKANWQLTKEVSWNWQLGYFKPGAVYNTVTFGKADPAWGAQGILSMTF